MRVFVILIGMALASSLAAQTKTPTPGGAYDAFTASVLTCLGESFGDQARHRKCLDRVIEDCIARAGIYESCLMAVQGSLIAARQRVEARTLETCDGGLDPACGVFAHGQALIASGSMVDAETWAEALKGDP